MKLNLFGKTIEIRKEYTFVGLIIVLNLLVFWGWYLRNNRTEVFVAGNTASDKAISPGPDAGNPQMGRGRSSENDHYPQGIHPTSAEPPVTSEKPRNPGEATGASRININTASVNELVTLNGIGEVKAQAIIAYREEHGPFESIDQIKDVKGIGEATFSKIKDHITVAEEPETDSEQ